MSIPYSPQTRQSAPWQLALKNLITCPKTLLAHLDLHPSQCPWMRDPKFPLRVTHSFVKRMNKRDPKDPLLRQVLSTTEESLLTNGFCYDALDEAQANPIPGVLHKYPGRILLTVTQSCPVHCRYCFRRHFPYHQNRIHGKNLPQILQYLNSNPSIHEIILSGGDPLMLTDQAIQNLIEAFNDVQSIDTIRLHTRMPIMIPERIDLGLIKAFKTAKQKIVMVYHINHPQEMIPEIQHGVKRLNKIGCMVFNQSVLLRGINDSASTLIALCKTLFQAHIIPYYVHLLDPVIGSQHFETSLANAQLLEQTLRNTLPGYMVPTFVKEIPRQQSKTPLTCIASSYSKDET